MFINDDIGTMPIIDFRKAFGDDRQSTGLGFIIKTTAQDRRLAGLARCG